MCHQDRPEVIATLDDLGFEPMKVEEVSAIRAAFRDAG
jgi:hypothetical protein